MEVKPLCIAVQVVENLRGGGKTASVGADSLRVGTVRVPPP